MISSALLDRAAILLARASYSSELDKEAAYAAAKLLRETAEAISTCTVCWEFNALTNTVSVREPGSPLQRVSVRNVPSFALFVEPILSLSGWPVRVSFPWDTRASISSQKYRLVQALRKRKQHSIAEAIDAIELEQWEGCVVGRYAPEGVMVRLVPF